MKYVAAVLALAVLFLTPLELHARQGPDNALGIDPARREEIKELMSGIEQKWADRFGRALAWMSITHDFPVGEVVSGPVADEEYWRYLGTSGGVRTGRIEGKGTGEERHVNMFEILYENLYVEVLKPAEKCREEITMEERFEGFSYDEIVRFSYDFIVAFDDTAEDELSYRIVMPMDVTVQGLLLPGDCGGFKREHCLLEASYGPLQMTTVQTR